MPPSGHRRSDARVRTHTQTDKPEITAPAAPSTGWAKVKMIQEVCCKYMKQIRVQKLQACKMSIKTGQRPTELSDGSVGGGSAGGGGGAGGGGVSDVEKTKNKRVRRIVVHVLRPPRHAAVWFTRSLNPVLVYQKLARPGAVVTVQRVRRRLQMSRLDTTPLVCKRMNRSRRCLVCELVWSQRTTYYVEDRVPSGERALWGSYCDMPELPAVDILGQRTGHAAVWFTNRWARSWFTRRSR